MGGSRKPIYSGKLPKKGGRGLDKKEGGGVCEGVDTSMHTMSNVSSGLVNQLMLLVKF